MKRILPYLKPYRGKMLLGMLLIAVSSVCSLLLPTIMSDILDGGIYTSDWDYILRCCGRMLLVTLLSLGAVAAGTWCRTQVVSGFCADLRAAVFGRVNALTFEEVSPHRHLGAAYPFHPRCGDAGLGGRYAFQQHHHHSGAVFRRGGAGLFQGQHAGAHYPGGYAHHYAAGAGYWPQGGAAVEDQRPVLR